MKQFQVLKETSKSYFNKSVVSVCEVLCVCIKHIVNGNLLQGFNFQISTQLVSVVCHFTVVSHKSYFNSAYFFLIINLWKVQIPSTHISASL